MCGVWCVMAAAAHTACVCVCVCVQLSHWHSLSAYSLGGTAVPPPLPLHTYIGALLCVCAGVDGGRGEGRQAGGGGCGGLRAQGGHQRRPWRVGASQELWGVSCSCLQPSPANYREGVQGFVTSPVACPVCSPLVLHHALMGIRALPCSPRLILLASLQTCLPAPSPLLIRFAPMRPSRPLCPPPQPLPPCAQIGEVFRSAGAAMLAGPGAGSEDGWRGWWVAGVSERADGE